MKKAFLELLDVAKPLQKVAVLVKFSHQILDFDEILGSVKPYGIDLSSGVESEPGRKDYNKMQELMLLARDA